MRPTAPSLPNRLAAYAPNRGQPSSTHRAILLLCGAAAGPIMLFLALAMSAAFLPLRTAVQIGADEGFELAKATLRLKGHPLYKEVWNDQPPLHTFLITQVLKHVSASILGPRLITIGFAALLLASLFAMARRIHGLCVATVASVILMASPGFLELSSSCMLEIPALAVALAALCVLATEPHAKIWKSDSDESRAGIRKRKSETNRNQLQSENGKNESAASSQAARSASLEANAPDCPQTPSHPDGASSPLFGISACPILSRACGFGFRISRSVGWREACSGTLFGAALLIKLVTVYLLPLAALIVWWRRRERRAAERGEGIQTAKYAENAKGKRIGPQGIFRCRWPSPTLLTDLTHLTVSMLAFGLGIFVAFVGLDYLIERGAFIRHFSQSWTSHFGAAKSFEYGSARDHPFDWSILLKNWDTTLPALLGGIVCVAAARRAGCRACRLPELSSSVAERAVSEKAIAAVGTEKPREPADRNVCPTARALGALPFAWLALSLIVFTLHKPWWPYYYIHTAIPLCWCAVIGIQVFFDAAKTRRSRTAIALLTVFGLCAGPWMAARVYLQISEIRHSPQTYSSPVLAEIARYKPFTDWIYCDEPIYSFHTGIPMPPSLAVMPLKRLWSGDMTNARIAEEMAKYRPGVILLANDSREVPFQDLLQAEYRLVYQDATQRLYADRSIIPKVKW
jgi:hypothetical protein